MKTYKELLTEAMTILGEKDDTVFLGQAIQFPGTGMSETLRNIVPNKKMELPVEEDFQLGLSIGLAMNGFRPISVFPRWNFLLLATNQLVNHLDKLSTLMNFPSLKAEELPTVIIRTAVGSVSPLYPGPQHVGDFTDLFSKMSQNVEFIRLDHKTQIVSAYEEAYHRKDGKSTVIVEWPDKYDE